MNVAVSGTIGRYTGHTSSPHWKVPDLRGPLVAAVVAAMITSVAVIVPLVTSDGATDERSTAAAAAAATSGSRLVADGAVPEGLTAEEWSAIQRQIAAAEAVEATPAIVARTPAAGSPAAGSPAAAPELTVGSLSARFVPSAAVVSTPGGDVTFRTARIGTVAPAATSAFTVPDGVEYRHGRGVTEWFRESASGLQQGFTIDAPVSPNHRLEIEVGVEGGTPRLVDGQLVIIDRPNATSMIYRDLLAWDVNDSRLPASMSVIDDHIVLTIETAGATYPITIDPTIFEDQKVLAHGSAGDVFGTSVATDANAGPGAIVVVGAPGDDTLGADVGAVFVYRSNGSSFDEETILYPPPTGATDFGRDVAVLGDRIVVGAPGDDANGVDAGAVFVYERSVSGWSLTSRIYSCDVGAGACGDVAAGGFDSDQFGRSVAIGNDGGNDVILVGAPGGSVGATPGGAAYVFEPFGTDWRTNSARAIANPNGAVGDAFGRAVDISTNGFNIVVGAPDTDDAGFVDAGMAWWFTYDGANVGGASRLAYGSFRGDSNNLGAAVTVDVHSSGDIVAFVGFPIVSSEPGDGGVATANGYVAYSIPGGTSSGSPVTFFQASTDGNGFVTGYGRSLDFDGSTLVVGAPLWDNPALDGGWVAASTYTSGPAGLTSVGVVDLPETVGDEWGDAVAVSGDVLVAAGRLVDLPSGIAVQVDAGQVGIAQVSNLATPAQLLSESTALDLFGWAVDIDGDRMAVSAPNSDLTGLSDAGAVYMFVRDDAMSPWVADGVILSPFPEEGGQFGDSIDLSGDRIAVGESDRLDQGEAGRVWVFERQVSGAWTQLGAPILRFAGATAYDGFGASVAFVDNSTLIIGAPGLNADAGGVFATAYSGGWALPVQLTTGTPDALDLVGWSVAAASGPNGRIAVAGAPGDDDAGPDAGGIYIWQDIGSGFGAGTTYQKIATDFDFAANDGVGRSVATDGYRIAAAGLGDQSSGQSFTGHVFEVTAPGSPGVWGKSAELFRGPLPVTVDGPANDFIDIFGGTVALGRPGNGGQVGIFRYNGATWSAVPNMPDDLVIPTETIVGDRVGFSVAIDGNELVVGGPGVSTIATDAGAAFSLEIPVVATFIGAVDADYETAGNWDVGIVPQASDAAVVPSGSMVEVSHYIDSGNLTLLAGGRIHVLDAGELALYQGWSGSPSQIAGTIEIRSGGRLSVPADDALELVGGTIDNLDEGTVEVNGSDASVTIGGTGTWNNSGGLIKLGGFPVSIGGGISWTSADTSLISVENDGLDMGVATYPELGEIQVAPGASISFADDLDLGATAEVRIGIDGPSATLGTYGTLDAGGYPSFGPATLTADLLLGYVPTAADSYTVITCGGGCDTFGTTNVAPFVATTNPTDVTLALPAATGTTVNSTGDAPDANPGDGVCQTATPGECTLRAAIQESNALAGAQTITFDVATGPQTIAPTSALPVITDTVTIDGYTQPGASANTLAVGSNAAILIELDGSSAGGVTGLDFRDAGSTGSVVRGLTINRINGYAIAAGPATQIRGNHIGTDPAGTTSLANSYGILIDTAATQPVTVGGTTPADRNVISGNTQIGIQVLAVGGTTADTTIVGNYIGTDSTGTAALPNGSEGIWVGADLGALVTGTTIGNGTTAGRNVISGNSGEGIAMWDNSTLTAIRGNYIGVGADGTTPLGNALVGGCVAFRCGGVVIRNSVSNNAVGGDLPGDGNVIANNPTGIVVFSGVNNRLVGNSIFDNVGAGLLVNPIADPIGSFNFFPPANDPGDPDTGANNVQNYPVMSSATLENDSLVVDFDIDSLVTSSLYPIQVDLYRADSAISGEGAKFIGRVNIFNPGSGTISEFGVSDLGVSLATPLVATATDANGNTSNFSPAITVVTPTVPANKVLPTLTTLERFGASVSIDGDWAAVGQPDTGGTGGAVSILERNPNDGSWSIVQTITDPTRDNFGLDVAIDGNTLAIAANVTGGGGEVQIHLRPDTSTPFSVSTYLGASADPVIDLSGDDVIIGTSGAVDIWSRASGSWQIELSTIGGPTFGATVAIDGDVAVVGDTSNTIAGSVLVYQRSGTTWTAADPLTNPDGVIAGSDWFGSALALDGTTLVVGHSLAENPAGDEGAAWVYEGSPGAWGTPQKLSGSTVGTGDVFGQSVDVRGDWIVVGSPAHEEVGSPTRDGGAYVFNRNGGTWVETDYLLADDRAANDSFGAAVAITDVGSGHAYLLVGAPFDDNSAGFDRGAAYSFEATAPVVAIPGRIYAPDAAAGDYFGQSVDIHDDWMVVGARQGDGAVTDSGSAYVFRRNLTNDEWEFVTELAPADGTFNQWFGWSVAISGTSFDGDGDAGNFVIAVGAPDLFGATDGAVYLYRYDFVTDDWAFTRKVTGPVGSVDFGFSVALEQTSVASRNGTYALAVGAPSTLAPANPGAAYLYRYTVTENPSFGDSLTLVDTADAPSPTNGAKHGFAVALDGDSLIVGEANAPSGALSNVGRAHVYRYGISGVVVFEGTLTQPAGDVVAGDNFGRTVDIDGDLAVVGSLFDKSGGPGVGSAYVYRRTGSAWGAAEELVSQAVDTENFGVQARVEDGIVAVSALLGGSNDAGTVQIFGYDASDGWVTGPALEWEGGSAGTNAGAGLALGEDGVLAVGTAEDDNAGGVDAGAVQVFDVSIPLPGNKVTTAQDIDLAEFGTSVDVDGEWAIVGAPGAGGTAEGSAYMFRKVAGEWQLFQELGDQFNPLGAGDDYGVAVAVGGDYAAVADQGDETSVYWFNGSSWVFSGDFFSPGFASNYFVDLDIDGANERLIVGYSSPGATTGQVDVFDLVPSGQPTINLVVEPGASSGTFYGHNVAIEGDLAFASAELDNSDTGSVVVFGRDGSTWTEIQSITPPSGAEQAFGSDLDVDGDRLIVGQPGGSRAWVFENVAGAWGAPVELASTGTQGGRSVAISGDLAIVGSPQATVEGVWAGSADVFARAGEMWVLTDTVSAADREFGDAFGVDVAISGGRLLVGAPFDTNVDGVVAGAGYFYDVTLPDNPVVSTFTFETVTSPNVSLVAAGFPADNITKSVVNSGAPGSGSVSSTPLRNISVDKPVGTDLSASPVASLTLGDLPLVQQGLSNAGIESPLDKIALTDLEVSVVIPNSAPPELGGWEYLFSQVAISNPPVGTALLTRPLQNITFGEVKGLPEVAALRLDEISVAGTPVASLPVASLVLGSTPVASLPTEPGQTAAETEQAWCDALAGSRVECPTSGLDPDLTLIELTLAGVPVASLPVASLPVASLPVASLPVASLPVASLDLAGTPVASLPVASLPVASLPVASLPVASLPVASLPVASLPVASLPTAGTVLDAFTTNGTLASVPVASLYLQGVPVASLPVASLPVASLPVASLPVASLPVASLPVASLDLTTLDVSGTPVASLTLDGTLATLPVASLPVASLPVASLPVASLPVASLPVASLPVASLPVASLPVASLPVASLPVASLPVASLPVASLPVASLPVASLPVASLDLVVDCSAFDCTNPNASLADALTAATRPGATFADLAPLLVGVRWGELFDALGLDQATFTILVGQLRNASGQVFTLADVLTEAGGFDDLTLGELPQSVLERLLLGDIAQFLTGLRLSDLYVMTSAGGNQLDPALVEQAITAAKNALTIQLQDLVRFDDMTLADLPDLNGLSLGQIAPYLTGVRFDDLLELFSPLTSAQVEAALVSILTASGLELQDLDTGEMTIGDLLSGNDQNGLTLGELLQAILDADANALDGITLGDLLLAFLSPTDYPWAEVAFDEVDTSSLPGVIGSVDFETTIEIASTTRSQQVEISVNAPGTASYLPGTATLNGKKLTMEPTSLGDALVWTLPSVPPGVPQVLGFQLQPTLDIGSSLITSTARIVGTQVVTTATSSINVDQAFEINDTPALATPLVEDTLYLTHIPTADDVDFFQIDVQDGQRLIVNLSNLGADFDVLVYGQSEAASIVPLVPSSGQSAGVVLEDPEFELDGTTQVSSELGNDAPVAVGLPVVATGNRRGVAAETVVTPPLEAGTVYVQVFGSNGANSPHPAVLQVRISESDDIPPCSALSLPVGGIPGGPSNVPADANTLVLVNQTRLSALYPSTYDLVTGPGGELEQLLTFLGGPGAGLGIVPGVVNVDSIAGIGAMYDQWDANPCDPTLANAVVAAITAEIGDLRSTRSIDNIMVVGGDDMIPMARVVDGADVSNEYDYRYTFGGNNAIAGAAWASQLLTDEPYGDTTALALSNRFLYITDVGIGRVVETPEDIAFQLDQFETAQGFLNPGTGLVVGYDFLDDGSEAIAADMRAAGLVVDDEYGSSTDADNWTSADLAAKLFPIGTPTSDLISINAHFDHRRALPASGNLTGNETDLFMAQTVFDSAPGSLTGRVTFSMGCHSGLNVSDATIGVLADDFAEAFSRQGGIYVGNTGYGYGDTLTVAYSERLMELFGERLVSPVLLSGQAAPTTAAQALQYAKNEFFAELGVVSVYDEKALMEATFYGIPFYRVGLDPVAPEPTPDNEPAIDPVTGDPAVSLTVVPTNQAVTTDDGVKYVNFDDSGDPLELKAPYNPSQPLEVVDVTSVDPGDPSLLGTVARGVMVVGMASEYVANDPVIVKPVADGSSIQNEPQVSDVRFPGKPATIRTTQQPEGTRQSIALATGQFRGSSSSGTQRLDQRLDLVVYYAPDTEDDFTAPTIRSVSSVSVGGQLSVTVETTDTGGTSGAGTGIDRVFSLLSTGPESGTTEWIGLNLVRVSPTSNTWVGSIGLPPGVTDIELMVQVKDGAGNVGYATNKAGNFRGTVTPPPPPPPAELNVSVTGGAPGVTEVNGWYDGPVLITAGAPGVPVNYRVDGGPTLPLPASGFTVNGDGSHVVEIIPPNAEPTVLIIRIDTTPPTVIIASPVDGSVVPVGTPLTASVACFDPSLVSCSVKVDGVAAAPNADLSQLPVGVHTVEGIAVDQVGNVVSSLSTFTVTAAQSPPEILLVDTPTTPQLITDGITVDIQFDDANGVADDYTVTVDWGNLDENETPGSADVCVAGTDSPTVGNPSCSITSEPTTTSAGHATASFVYPKPGVYLVTVTVEDSAGNSSVMESKFVVVYDPAAGRVSGAGWYWSGNEAYDDGNPWGNLANFGYNARYQNGATVPSGKTQLKLIGEFFFKSTSYDYLIINDTVAVAEGVGEVGKNGGYRFRVQGIDNGWLDFFQITIWNDTTGEVLYDNGVLYDDGDLVLLGGIKIKS